MEEATALRKLFSSQGHKREDGARGWKTLFTIISAWQTR